MSKNNLWSWPGMKEVKPPKPIKCFRCGKEVGWKISLDQFHYETEPHFVFEAPPNMRHHNFNMNIPRYE